MIQENKQNSDEIDIRDLVNYIGRGFKNIFVKFIDLLVLIRRTSLQNKTIFIVAITVFLTLAFSYTHFVQGDVFGSSMLVKSGYLNTQVAENSINQLDILSQEKDKTTLAETLGIDLETATKITGFEIVPFVTEEEKLEVELLKEKLINLKLEEEIINSIASKIEIRNPNTFKITVFTESNSVISELDSAIVNYFLNKEFIKKRISINRILLKKRKEKLITEQIKIDSLKHAIFEVYQSLSKQQSGQGSDNVILAGQEVTNPLSVFKEDISINDDILSIESALYLKNEFEVIEGLVPFSKPVSISFKLLIIYSILTAIVFTYLLLMLVGLNKFLAEREKAS